MTDAPHPRLIRLAGLQIALFAAGDDEDPLSLAGIDGLIAATLISPKPFAPDEWIPYVWSRDTPGVVGNVEVRGPTYEGLMRYRDDQMADLERGRYWPLAEADTEFGYDWKEWAEGFDLGFGLRGDEDWRPLVGNADEGVRLSLTLLSRLHTDATDLSKESDKIAELLRDDPGRLIAGCMRACHSALGNRTGAAQAPGPAKLGRNDPCPCGSGKKYKKCCLRSDAA